jgi:hypothetical protein
MRAVKSKLAFLTCAALAAILTISGASTPTARADDPDAIGKMKKMAREAMEHYDLMEYEEAKKFLNRAIALAKRKRMNDHPLTAQLYLHLGIVYFSGFQDVESAKVAFIDAVSIDPNIQLNPAYKTGDMEKLLSDARSEFGGGTGGDSGGGKPAAAEPVDDVDCGALVGISHMLVDSGKAGQDQPVTAHVSKDLNAAKIALYYRTEGKADFVEVAMKKRGTCGYTGVVPADAMVGDVLHYYIAVYNDGGKVIAKKGSSASPNIMELTAGGGSIGAAGSGGDNENPLGGGVRRSSGGGGGGEVVGSLTEPGYKTWFVSVAVGSGGGLYLSDAGETEQARQTISAGFAPTPVQLAPEVGYRLSAKNAVALQVRLGLPLGADIAGHATAAPAGFVRFHHAFSAAGEGLSVNGALGGGIIRQTVPLAGDMGTDTAATGPLFVGGGVGYIKSLGTTLKFVADLGATLGLPIKDSLGDCSGAAGAVCTPINFAVQVDANIGLQLGF